MKIKKWVTYFNDTDFGKFYPDNQKEDTLLLSKKYRSFSKRQVENWATEMTDLGYKIIFKLKNKWFLWSIVVGRIVPLYQRLITYQTIINDKTKRVTYIVSNDIIMYGDESLIKMSELNKESSTLGVPTMNTGEVLKSKYRKHI